MNKCKECRFLDVICKGTDPKTCKSFWSIHDKDQEGQLSLEDVESEGE